MRILALDIGDARIGCAISDPREKVATPLCVLPAADVMGHAASFRRVLQDWEPDLLLAGLPYTMAAAQGPQAARVKEKAARIAAACELPLEFTDERLSSQEAKRSLREKGFSEREMRGKIDMIAASLFLQAWLDARALPA
ncbi:MAG: Holliday junction resolvase RuvX [Eggerthellaceae bacterium]